MAMDRSRQAQQRYSAKKAETPKTPPPPPTWVIMIYIAADNTLANFAIETLKQLNRTGDHDVVVTVQFAVDAPGGQRIPRYIFDHPSTESVEKSIAGYLDAPKNMTEQEALASFLSWAYAHKKLYAAKYYALILWGHGPELLFQPPSGQVPTDPCGDPRDDNHGLYLNPIELRDALKAGIPQKGGKPDPQKAPQIIGFDACSMAMVEVAYEIRDYAKYMVASQEEVPDLSFPYDTLVDHFKTAKGDVEKLCQDGIKAYVLDYQDYICNTNTGMKEVMLSAVRLGKLDALIGDLKELADALYDARTQPGLPNLLVTARENSKAFAGGLYVDICDFCDNLRGALDSGNKISSSLTTRLEKACTDVCSALTDPNGCILANQTTDVSHGLSIYFPYMNDDEVDEVQQPIVKGGTDTIGKGFAAILNRAAPNALLCIRRQLIVDTEEYYGDLALAAATYWYRFIQQVWSRILAASLPHELDLRYSAQQSAMNLEKTVELLDK